GLPSARLVLALRRDVPAGPGSADGERGSTALGRMEDIADIRLGRGLVAGRPPAVDPTTLEEERELAVADLLTHRGPRLRRGEDVLRAQAIAVGLGVVGHDLANGRAVPDPLAALVLKVAPVGPKERD